MVMFTSHQPWGPAISQGCNQGLPVPLGPDQVAPPQQLGGSLTRLTDEDLAEATTLLCGDQLLLHQLLLGHVGWSTLVNGNRW